MRTVSTLTIAAAVVAAAVASIGCSDLGNGRLPPPHGAAAFAVQAPPRPGVEITTPARASFLATGPVAVEGRATPYQGTGAAVHSLEVNGKPVTFTADGRFRTLVTLDAGLNVIRALATDTSGQTGSGTVGVLAGTWRPLSGMVDEAAALRLNDAGLDGVEKLIEEAIINFDLTAISQTPAYQLNVLTVALQAWVQQIRFGNVSVGLDAQADGLHVVADLSAPQIDFDLVVAFGGAPLPPERVAALADHVIIRGRLVPRIGAGEKIDLKVEDPRVEMPGLRIVVASPILQTIESILRILTQAIVEDQVRRAIAKMEPTVQPMPVDANGAQMTADIRGNWVRFDDTGLEVAAKVNCLPAAFTARGQAAPGFYHTPGTVPGLSTSYGIHIALDDDLLNHAAHAAWASGMLKFDAQNLALAVPGSGAGASGGSQNPASGTGTGTGTAPAAAPPLLARDILTFMPELYGKVPETAPVSIGVEAHLPPLFRVGNAPDVLILEIGEMIVDLKFDRGNGFETGLKVAAHISTAVNVGLDSSGLWLSTATTPRISFDVIDEPIADIDDRRIEVALGVLLTPALPHFINKSNMRVPIPYVNSLSFFNVQVQADGPQLEHVSVISNLSR